MCKTTKETNAIQFEIQSFLPKALTLTVTLETMWERNISIQSEKQMRKEMFLLHIFLSLDDRLFLKLMFSFCSCEMMIDKKWNRGDGGVSPACLVYILGDNYSMQTPSEDDSV